MDPKWRGGEPDVPKGDSLIVINVKSIGIAAMLTGVAWAATAIVFKYF